MEAPSQLADFATVTKLPIQWGDQDAFGHVNNTVPIRWFESARVAYLQRSELVGWMTPGGIGPILVSISCNYRKQLRFPDNVFVTARVAKVGRTSFVIEHSVFSESQNSICADGCSTVVLFNYATQRPIRIPDEIRAKILAIEKTPPDFD